MAPPTPEVRGRDLEGAEGDEGDEGAEGVEDFRWFNSHFGMIYHEHDLRRR